MKNSDHRSLTVVEVLVAIGVLLLLFAAVVLLLVVGHASRPGQMTESLAKMRRLYLVTEQMARDGHTGFPGDTHGSFSTWANDLVGGGYLSTNELCSLLSAPGKEVRPPTMLSRATSAILVYAAGTNSSPDTVLFSTANFTNTPTGGVVNTNAAPFGRKGFVVFRVGGEGRVFNSRDAGNKASIGSFASLCP